MKTTRKSVGVDEVTEGSGTVFADLGLPDADRELTRAKVKTGLNVLLHAALPTPCFDRPFVCDGRPECCTAIVIGENPATRMDKDWWSFWSDGTGFNLRMFEDHYETARRAAGKRPISNTRLRLKRLRSRGLLCLETNAFTNERLGGHGASATTTALTPMLLANLPSLRAVIAHGKVAHDYLSGLSLPEGVDAHRVRHFRSLSYIELDAITKHYSSNGNSSR